MIENIEVFTQSSIRVKGRVGTIYVDPFQMKEEPHDADFILITHEHYDHFSPEDIAKVVGDHTVLVVPEKMRSKADEAADLVERIETVKPGVYREISGLKFDTVPAYNCLKPFHPKSAEWVGYNLHVDGKRIYIAGDTDATKEAKAVQCDIALAPIGGIYTMDAKEAADLVNAIRPEVAIPTHYGSIVGRLEDADVFAKMVEPRIRVEFKIGYVN